MITGFLSTKDLSALSLTSTYHRSFTEPTLYKEIRWNPRDLDILWPQYHWAPIHLLLRTLMSRPGLASYIRGFAINCRRPRNGTSHSTIWRSGEPEYSTDDMGRATALIKSLHLQKSDKWIVDLKRGEVDLILGLLISTFTNLRCFHLSTDYQQVCKFYFGEMLGRLVTENSLCDLETIEFGRRGTLCESFDEHFDEFCSHSAIERQVDLLFSVSSLKHISMSLPNKMFSPSFSLVGLSSLDLHHCTIRPSGLGRILLATPRLQSLKYDAWVDINGDLVEAGEDWDYDINEDLFEAQEDWDYLDCAELGQGLAHVKFMLVHLYISFRIFFSTGSVGVGQTRFPIISTRRFFRTVGKVGTLRDFTKLTSLSMPTTLVVDCTTMRESYRSVRLLPLEIANLLPVNTLKQLLLSDDPSLHPVM